MTLQQAVDYAATKLVLVSDNPRLDAQLLVCHACGIEQTRLFAHPDVKLSCKEETVFKCCFSSRLQGEPFAYITGTKEFWSLDFIVNKHVLIPRPETELLVEVVLRSIPDQKGLQVLDLGTGSGAIAVAIAKERSHCRVVATDISEAALEVAKLNAARHGVEIVFIHSDWYGNLGCDRYDAIVSNPPYIAEGDPNLDDCVIQHEPHQALISGRNGLQDIELIVSQAGQYLNRQGCVMIEHGFQQGTDTRQLFQQNKFIQIQTHQDLSGQDRVSCARLTGD